MLIETQFKKVYLMDQTINTKPQWYHKDILLKEALAWPSVSKLLTLLWYRVISSNILCIKCEFFLLCFLMGQVEKKKVNAFVYLICDISESPSVCAFTLVLED